MRCEQVLTLLPDFVDGSLPQPLAEIINDHVRHCASCWYNLMLLERRRIRITVVQTKIIVITEVGR